MNGDMPVKFEFDEQALAEAIAPGMQAYTDELQQALDDVHARHQGQPVETVKAALRARLAQVPGASSDEPLLSEYAEHIAAGNPIQLNYRP